MNKTVCTLLIFVMMSCKQGQSERIVPVSDQAPSVEERGTFHWLLGSWERTNEKEDRATFELWEKESETAYLGLGFTLKEGDTIWQERMILQEDSGIWTLNIWPSDETEPVIFTLTDISDSAFISVNPDHDFPNKITYRRHSAGISATISDDEMEIPFNFVPLKE